MTTHSRPPSPAPAPDRRITLRRLVLAAARGESLQIVAEAGLGGACASFGWPVGRLGVVEFPPEHGEPRLVATIADYGGEDRPDLVDALSGPDFEPGSERTAAVTTGRPSWSKPGCAGDLVHLAVPLTHGSVVGFIELVDDRPHSIEAPLLDELGEIAEILGAVVARDRAAERSPTEPSPRLTPALRSATSVKVTDPLIRAVLDRLEVDQERLREAEIIGSFGVWELLPGRELVWSEELCRIHGLPPDFVPTLEANVALIHATDLPAVDAYMTRMRTERSAPPVRYRIRRPGGEVRWVESHARILEGDRVIGITRDITEQRARDQRDRLQGQIAQTMAEGVTLVRADGTIVYVNPQFAAMFGYEPHEMEGRLIWDFNAPEHRPPAGTVTNPRPVEFQGELRHIRRDGTVFVTEATVTAMPIDGGEAEELAWLAVERDITEEKLQSEALRESEERLALIQQHAPIGLALVNLDGRFVQTNPALCAITGRADTELRELTLRDITHPEDVDAAASGLARLLGGGGDDPTLDIETRYVRPNGEVVWVAVTAALARDEDGVPRHVIAQVMDIGERKRAEAARARHAAELERSNVELRRATADAEQANKAKNEFLSRMSHELRTPLNAVLGFAQLLGMEDLADTQLDMVDQVLRGGRHLLLLVDEVLDIARMENGTMAVGTERVDVGAAVDHARSLLEPLVRDRDIRVDTGAIGAGLPPVRADRQRVVQILLNLLSNAVKYNAPGGDVTVSARSTTHRLHISVHDTGPGIAPEVLPRVFEPFDRLGAEQTDIEGTGIGLTVSRALADQMGGRLTVYSRLGKGSTFTLVLPLFDGPPPATSTR